jgi:hypothetical protein
LEFISDTILYIILRGNWCNIIVFNVHTPCEDKVKDVKDGFYDELGHVFDQFHRYNKGDFNAKVGRENYSNPTIRKESLHEISNDSGARLVNSATKNLVVKSTMFPHRKIHKCTRTSSEGNTHNHINHVLIERRRHSSILDV